MMNGTQHNAAGRVMNGVHGRADKNWAEETVQMLSAISCYMMCVCVCVYCTVLYSPVLYCTVLYCFVRPMHEQNVHSVTGISVRLTQRTITREGMLPLPMNSFLLQEVLSLAMHLLCF